MTSKNRRHKKLLSFLVLIIILGGVSTYALLKPLPAITNTSKPIPGITASTVSLPWPSYGQAAVGAVGYGVLATNGSQTPLPTASIAKIMTALLVLKQKPLNVSDQGPTITLTQEDVDSYNKYVAEDGSVVAVAAGQQLTEYQLLQAMLLPSANNIAETLARWAYGSIDDYAAAANQYAKSQGWTSMTITDPSGFLPSTVASAQDLTKLGVVAIQNPVIAAIVAQPTASLPTVGAISNVNKLLGQEGTIGIKTGNNDQDLGAYLFAANRTVNGKTVTVVGTVMDGPNLGTALVDSLPIIRSTASNFVTNAVIHNGTVVGAYQVPWQGTVPIIASQDRSLTSWKASSTSFSVTVQKQALTHGKAGTNVGSVVVQNSLEKSTVTSQAVLSKTIAKPSISWRLHHVF